MATGARRDRDTLVRLDKAHVWHPFTQMQGWLAAEPLVIERGEGCWLVDVDGRRYIDGVSSLWVNVHGHTVPEIDEAVSAQLGRIAHSTLLGLANALMWPAIFPMAIRGLGSLTRIGAALLVMGIAGGAIVPQVYARLKDVMSPQSAFFWSTLPCYLYILYYSMKGHLAGQRQSRRLAPTAAD